MCDYLLRFASSLASDVYQWITIYEEFYKTVEGLITVKQFGDNSKYRAALEYYASLKLFMVDCQGKSPNSRSPPICGDAWGEVLSFVEGAKQYMTASSVQYCAAVGTFKWRAFKAMATDRKVTKVTLKFGAKPYECLDVFPFLDEIKFIKLSTSYHLTAALDAASKFGTSRGKSVDVILEMKRSQFTPSRRWSRPWRPFHLNLPLDINSQLSGIRSIYTSAAVEISTPQPFLEELVCDRLGLDTVQEASLLPRLKSLKLGKVHSSFFGDAIEQVAQHAQRLTHLECECITPESLKKLPNLVEVNVTGQYASNAFESLPAIAGLQFVSTLSLELVLSYTQAASLIASMANLKTCILGSVIPASRIGAVCAFEHHSLVFLHIKCIHEFHNPNIKSIELHCPKLRHLQVLGCSVDPKFLPQTLETLTLYEPEVFRYHDAPVELVVKNLPVIRCIQITTSSLVTAIVDCPKLSVLEFDGSKGDVKVVLGSLPSLHTVVTSGHYRTLEVVIGPRQIRHFVQKKADRELLIDTRSLENLFSPHLENVNGNIVKLAVNMGVLKFAGEGRYEHCGVIYRKKGYGAYTFHCPHCAEMEHSVRSEGNCHLLTIPFTTELPALHIGDGGLS